MVRLRPQTLCACGLAALLAGAPAGCNSERTQTGTQAPVTDEMVREADASSDYLMQKALGGTPQPKHAKQGAGARKAP